MKLRWSHAVLYVRDLERMLAFYRDVLGFQVSDRGPLDPNLPGVEVVFLSQVGSDHHQIAFAPVRGEGPSTTLDHMAFRVDSLADVKDAVARLRADGRATGIAGISHGNAWSVYFKDPEENMVEIFCDTPYHVPQPQLVPLDLDLGEAEIRRVTEEYFGSMPGFTSMDEFRAAQRRRFGE